MAILAITAAQRLDSRGMPTVQVTMQTECGIFRSIVPSGASKGDYEAVELRDGDTHAFHGRGVTKAVHNVEQIIAPAILKSGLDPAFDLKKIDEMMIALDGTPDKSNLGANALLAVSMAAARAGAAARDKPLYEFIEQESGAAADGFTLPVPFMNVLNGGEHSGNHMAFQEFMIAPVHAGSFAQAVQWNVETYMSLRALIVKRFGTQAVGLGDEGGFAPPVDHPRQALDLLVQAIEDAGHTGKIKIGIDPASQSFFTNGKYDLGFKTNHSELLDSEKLGELYQQLLEEYPIVLLEDPFGQDDWTSFAKFHASSHVELVGDDLLATNRKRIAMAIEKKACNSLLLKVNQIGTVTEALQAATQAFEAGWSVFVSHRSGETTDDFIADLTVGLKTGHLKSGAPARGERVAKYNRLMDIEDEMRSRKTPHQYAGTNYRTSHSDTRGPVISG